MQLGELSQLVLPDHAGIHHKLGEYWKRQSVVLVFLRHFG